LGLLAEAYERCRGPEDLDAPPLDRARLKELIREIDLWSSSCMVALEGTEPVGVLLGAKREAATLVAGLRVRPGHRRRGHARHLLTSLGSKLAILGPPRLIAEVPADRVAALALFEACGWRREGRLVDWRRSAVSRTGSAVDALAESPIAPLTVEEALASGLIPSLAAGWKRDPGSFLRQADRLASLGFYSADRLEALLLHRAPHARGNSLEILALGATASELGRLGLRLLLAELERDAAGIPIVLPRVAPAELEPSVLDDLSFTPESEHLLFATEAKAA
jgi:GNAT superfamily N-acetyltransferase